ncbi:MAG: hypothetical protein WAK35_13360 [Xanthobacteraceae bacterium]
MDADTAIGWGRAKTPIERCRLRNPHLYFLPMQCLRVNRQSSIEIVTFGTVVLLQRMYKFSFMAAL